MDEDVSLEAEIRRLISRIGPLSVADYMDLCLTHPRFGYYMTRDPFGVLGDFTTAPEISQMFGELLGLWTARVWQLMGEPENVRVVELGPGRGTLMRDALKAAEVVPAFRKAVVAHLVEISPALTMRQRDTLEDVGVPTLWHRTLSDVPEGPTIVLANEYFDALPMHQAVKQNDGWYERVIKIGADGNLGFGLSSRPLPLFERALPSSVRNAKSGEIFEWRSNEPPFELGRRLHHSKGAALIVDYGHAKSATGDTFQAVGAHAYAEPLVNPGAHDLTAHVDFQALGEAGELMGVRIHGPIEQGEFLKRLGIDQRAAALKAQSPRHGRDIDRAWARLIAGGRTSMGRMFKVMAFAHSSIGELPGFE